MHKFHPDNAHKLENEARYFLIPPVETLRRFGLRTGMTVVDIGAGTGYFARAAASIVGASGRVYAFDMENEMVSRLRDSGLSDNVRVSKSEEYDLPLEEQTADLTILAFVAHENQDVPRLIREAARVTKPAGRILLIDWKKQREEHGPPEEERLAETECLQLLHSYTLLEHGELNQSHYYCIIQKPDS